MKHFKVYWLSCVLMIAAVAASATTIVLPTDEQLIAKSPLIVSGTVLSSEPVVRDNGIWTETVIAVDHTIKGSVDGTTVTVREVGGVIGDRITKVWGSPEYTTGERVLAFLAPTPRGDYQTVDLLIGKFSEGKTLNGERLWLRYEGSDNVTLLDAQFNPIEARNVQRDADRFERFVDARVAGRTADANYGVANPVLQLAKSNRDISGRRLDSNFTLIAEGTVYRWGSFDSGKAAKWYSYGTQPGYTGGGVSEVQTAMAVWTGYSQAKILYQYSGVSTTTPGGLSSQNGINEVVFNDPKNEIEGSWNPSTGGIVGRGGFNGVGSSSSWTSPFAADAAHPQSTFNAVNITEGNLVIQDNVSPSQGLSSARLAEIVAHEFGHTLGFGHSSDPNALMYATLQGLGPSLRADDQVAARWLYPNGSGGNPQPTNPPNAPTSLTATVSGENVTLHWTDNASNETLQSVYVAAETGPFTKATDVGANQTSVALTGFVAGQTYRLYVTASNSGGESQASNTVTITAQSALQAVIGVSPATGVAGQTTFQFTDGSTGTVISRLWNFNDGTTSSQASPTHIFANAGTYAVTLTVNGPNATSSTATRNVTVTAPLGPLTADFSYTPAAPTTNDAIAFTDQSTGGVTSWMWDFGDGTTSTTPSPSKKYAIAGSYVVRLTVFRNEEQKTAQKTVSVTSPNPGQPTVTASFDYSPSIPMVGDTVQFHDKSSGATQWSWSFGDGSTSTQQNPSHKFAGAGTYTVTLTASNNSGSSSVATQAVSIVTTATNLFRTLIPVTAQTNGAGGTTWRTELTIFNSGNEAANVQLLFIPGAGSPTLTHDVVLLAHESVTFANALLEAFQMTSGAGAIAINASGATVTPQLKVTSRTFTDGAKGTYGQAVPDESSDLSATQYITGIETDGDYRTNIGLVNRSNATVNASMQLFDADGNLFASANLPLAANSFQQSSLSAYFPAASGRSLALLSLKVTADAANALSVYASVVDNRTQDPIYLQGAQPATSPAIIPAVGRIPGANGTSWRSDVMLYNPSSTPLTVNLRFLLAGADNRGAASAPVTLQPNQSKLIADVVASLGIASGNGALELNWTGSARPVIASRTYTPTTEGGTYGQSIDAIDRYAAAMDVPGLRSDASFRSNVGFVNSGDSSITVGLTLLSSTGSVLGTNIVTLKPKSQTQTSLVALFPAAANAGTVTLQAGADAPTMFAYGSIVDNASGDPVFYAGR